MNSLTKIGKFAVSGASRMHSSPNVITQITRTTHPEARAGLEKLQSKQAKFQVENDLPVHVKGGAGDQIMYRATWGLIFVGLGFMGHFFYEISYPPQNN